MKKRILLGIAAFGLVMLFVGALFHLQPPTIKANNIAQFHNQISSNAPLVITFSQLMNRESVEKGITLEPAAAGRFSWFFNALTFIPEERFTVGTAYTLTVPKTVTNVLGKSLDEEIILNFLVIDPPKVSLAVPKNETSVDSKITVMFDRPMVEFTTLDEGDSRKIPAQISPEISGRFKWIGTSAFQFIPENRFSYSTEYSVAVPEGISSLDGGKLEQSFTFSFRTPRLNVTGIFPNAISAHDSFPVEFNQEVNLESVINHTTVKSKNGDPIPLKAQYQKRKGAEREITDQKIVELLPMENDWGYDNSFSLEISKGIAGLEGNLAAEFELKNYYFNTNAFLTSKYPRESEATGRVKDELYKGEKQANPSGRIELRFDQEVDLGSVREIFSLEPREDLKANYGEKCDPKWEPEKSPDEKCPMIEDRAAVVFMPRDGKLKNLTTYTAKLAKSMRAKNGIAYLREDVLWKFITADVFKILRTDPPQNGIGSYSRLCVFTNNPTDTEDLAKNIKEKVAISPSTHGKISVSSYELGLSATATAGDYYYGEKRPEPCRQKNREEKYALEVRPLLDPSTKHTFVLKGDVKDIYGQSLGYDFSTTFTTDVLKDTDTSLQILQDKMYATVTLDQHAMPVIAAQNLDSFDLEICRLDAEKFIDIDAEPNRPHQRGARYYDFGWPAFRPSETSCSEYKKNVKKLGTAYWEKQYVEVDLKKEWGKNPEPGYYFLRASSPKTYRIEKDYEYNSETGQSVPVRERKVMIAPFQVISVTNLHLAVKSSRDNGLFWVTDLSTGKPVDGASVQLFTETGVPLAGTPQGGFSRTDKNGIAKRDLHGLRFEYILASFQNDRVVLGNRWNEGISPWEYQLNYSPLERYTQGYIYTERPLYQPTHEVFFKGILRDDNDAVLRAPQETSIFVEATDSRGTKMFAKKFPVSPQGTFNGSIKLDASAPLGRYTLSGCLERNEKENYCARGYFDQIFHVEEYRKPEYKLDVAYSKDSYVNGEELQALIDAQYFFGAPLPDAKLNWSLKSQNYYFDEYKGEWFSFTDYETFRKCYFGCPYDDQYLASGSGNLDAHGKFTVKQKLDLSTKDSSGKIQPPDSGKIYTLIATVVDKNNQSVSGSKEIMVHRGEFYVGVKNERYVVNAGEKAPIKVIAVDFKGNPLPGKSIEVELFKAGWKYVKKKNIGGGFYWDNEPDNKSLKKVSLSTDDDGKARYEFSVKEGGEYFVRATGTDSKGNFFSATTDFYATSAKEVHWKQENNNRMDLKLDKLTYEVGDTAKVFVKSPYQNVKALITYERGNIFETKVVEIDSNAYVLEVPITEKMIPNFYVSVLAAKSGGKDDPPDFKLGYINVPVETKNRELIISLKTDKERYQPRDRVKLEITTTDRKGNPAAADLSIAAVDASLLALKGNPKRDLVNVFYGARALGVWTVDTLTTLLQRINILDLQGAKGGSGKGSDEFGMPRGKFEDTAFWRSSLTTDANGRLSTSFALPDNLTTWNIEIIGHTQNSLFGSANETVTTQKPVMIRPVLPRFVLLKDQPKLGAIVHNFTDARAVFEVSLETENLEIISSKTQKVAIPAGGSKKVLWETKIPKVNIGAKVRVTIKAKGNDALDAVEQTFPVYSYATPETVALSSYTDDVSFTEKVLLPKNIDPDFGELKITTGATLATYLSDSLNYLLQYPYWCVEQILSRLVPNVVLKNSVALPALKDKIKLSPIYDENGKVIDFDTMVSQSLQRLAQYQRGDGGFGYFEGGQTSFPSITAYAVFAFNQLQKAGYSLDQNMVRRAQNYLFDYMRLNKDLKNPYDGKLRKKDSKYANNRAYMLFVLAETGQGDLGLTNNLSDDEKLLGNGGKAYLAMTFQKLSPNAFGKIGKLLEALENQVRIDPRGAYIRNDIGSSFDMMTHAKVTALTIQAFTRVNPDHPLIPKLVKWLIGTRKDGHWETTQDNVSSLIALTEYLIQNKETDANYKAKISINGKIEKQYLVGEKNILDQQEIVKSLSGLKIGDTPNPVIFSKEGTGRIYYDMALRYFLPIEEIKPRGEGFNIERQYYRADDKKLEHPVKIAKAGETLRGRLTIVVPEERYAVAVENFLPAGFELVNFDFENVNQKLVDEAVDETFGEDQPMPPSYGYTGYMSSSSAARREPRRTVDCEDCGDGYFYGFNPWTHRELRTDRLFLFAEHLPKGVYEYDYFVQVTSEGDFHHPPAVISEMYFPENFGRTSGQWMKIEE